MERLIIVGPGRVGLSLGDALWQAGAVRDLVFCGRRPEPPSHPLFAQRIAAYHFGLLAPPPGADGAILAVPDDVLPEMAYALAALGPAPTGSVVLHTSGSLSTEVLGPLHAVGYSVGSLHPLQSLAHPVTGAAHLVGSAFAVSGEAGARTLASRIALALNGEILEIPVNRRASYHAAAVLAANGLAALIATAAELLIRSGVDPDVALPALVPLMRGALDNVSEFGLERGLTGPLVRGDLESVDLHLRTLEGESREVYRALSRVLVRVAEARGLDAATLDGLRALLQPPRGAPFQEIP